MKKITFFLFMSFMLSFTWQSNAQLIPDNTCTTSFDDISATGTDLALSDDGEANITIPFAFTLDGVSSTDLRVGNNGGVLFNTTTGEVSTSSTPTAQGFYPFSDDIDSDYGTVVWETLGTAPNRRVVIMWNDRPHYSNSASGATFEIILYETTNEIAFLYQDTDFGDATADDAISAGIRIVGANGTYVYSTNTALAGVTCINWTIPTDELDYYNLQWPATGTIVNGDGHNVYAQCYEAGLTDVTTGQAPGVECWIGYSSADTDPSGTGWTWVPAAFDSEQGNNDQYILDLDAEVGVGIYYYAARWRLNSASFFYGGIQADGSFGGVWGAEDNVSGVLTVNPALGEACSNPIALAVEADCGSATPYIIDYATAFDLGAAGTCDTTTGNTGAWFEFTAPTSGAVTINTSDTNEIVVLDACGGTEIICNSTASASHIVSGLTATNVYYLAVWKDSATTGTTNVCIEDLTCPSPSGMTASSVTTTTADLTWTAGAGENAWNIEYKADADFTPGTGAEDVADTASGTPAYYATMLTPATTYYVYYQADCGGGDTSEWVGPFVGTTLCEIVDNFSENFDSVSTPDLPNCWSGIVDNGASSFAYVETSTAADNSAPNGVSLYNSSSASTSNIMLVSPELSNLNAGTHRLTFSARNSSETQDIEVGTLSDSADGSTFTVLETVDLSTTHTAYIIDFSGYSGTDSYIAIRRISTSTYTYVYLDDIVWEMIPVGPPICSTITSPADMATGVSNMPTLSWVSNVDATGYKLKIGTTDGGAEFLAETDLGDVLTYDVLTTMAYTTTYYVTLTPYNLDGDAVSCASTSFTTFANPNYGGGPDGADPNNPNSGGYYFANSTADASVAVSQPTYNWIDPVAEGHTEITSWTSGSDDDGYFTIPDLGFDFDFYGNIYRTSDVFVNSNGALLFGAGVTSTGGAFSIPNVADADNFIAGCWQDLDDGTDGKIYYGGTSDKMIITWWHYQDYLDSTEYITFQIIINSNGNIIIQYNDVESSADELGDPSLNTTFYGDALIGIENLGGDKGIQYRNNGFGGPIFGSPLALSFSTNSSTLNVENQSVFDDFNYFPNPVNGTLSLRAQENMQNVAVYNMLGQEVINMSPNSMSNDLDMSALSRGTYFVKVSINGAVENFKIIKE